MKKTIIFLGLIASSSNLYAGLFYLTAHSRANCINNESISWDATKPHFLKTISRHSKAGHVPHAVISDWSLTYRSAAICIGEGFGGGWTVEGLHYKDRKNDVTFAHDIVTDCQMCKGWGIAPEHHNH